MKRIFTLLSIALMSVGAFAQGPVVEATYFPVPGTRFKHAYDTMSTQFNTLPSSTPGTHWRYDTIFQNPTMMFPYTTYYGDTARMVGGHPGKFPQATHASYLRGAIEDSTWVYIKADTNGIHYVGAMIEGTRTIYFGATPYSYNVDSVEYIGHELVMPSIVSMSTNIQDQAREITRVVVPALANNKITLISNIRKTFKGYSYGTLTTPEGTWTDVLVVQETEMKTDTVIPSPPFTPSYFPEDTVIRYHFVRNNTFGTSHLQLLKYNDAGRTFHYGFYVKPTTFGSIGGTVFDSSGVAVNGGTALLYREHSLFSRDDVLDSVAIDGAGNYAFDSIPYGVYRIAARPSALYSANNAMTTYYGDTTDWINADELVTLAGQWGDTNGVDTNNVNITLVYGPNTGGSNSINGNLSWNWTKSGPKATGDPLPGVDILIRRKPGDKPVSGDITGGPTGHYNIPNIPDGTYDVFVDVPGCYHASTYTVTVSGGQVIGCLDFQVSLDSIYTTCWPTYTEGHTSNKTAIRAVPNPFNEATSIQVELEKDAEVRLEVYNLLGVQVYSTNNVKRNKGVNQWDLEEGMNSAGVYLVKLLVDNQHSQTLRIVKE